MHYLISYHFQCFMAFRIAESWRQLVMHLGNSYTNPCYAYYMDDQLLLQGPGNNNWLGLWELCFHYSILSLCSYLKFFLCWLFLDCSYLYAHKFSESVLNLMILAFFGFLLYLVLAKPENQWSLDTWIHKFIKIAKFCMH